jgi:hypothetical protein
LRKTFLNGLHDSPAKVFLGFSRQRASILFFHARHTTTLLSNCHLYYAPISKWLDEEGMTMEYSAMLTRISREYDHRFA